MDLTNQTAYKNATKKRKRVGRGEASGQGKTSGRGHKGLKSRSGGKSRPGFEGGQTPLYRQLPKLKGFKPINLKDYDIISLSTIEKLKEDVINTEVLKSYGLIPKRINKVKILASGEIKRKVSVQVHYISKAAKQAIEKAGGKVEVLNG